MSGKPTYEELVNKINKLEQALLSSQRDAVRFRQVLDCAPSVIYTKDLDGRYTLVNRLFEELSGFKSGELIGKTDFELFPEDTAENAVKNDKKVIETGKAIEIEEFGPVKGEIHNFLSSKYPLISSDGQIDGLCGISTDITERKEAERSKKETIERMRFAMESAAGGFWEWDFETNMVTIDDPALKMIGYEPGTPPRKGEWWIAQIHPDERSLAARAFTDYREGKTDNYSVEFRIKGRSGEYMWVASNARIFRYDKNGKPLLVIGTHHDISRRKNAEIALKESEERYKLAMEFANDGLFDWNLETNEVYYSPVWKSLLGYNDDEIKNDFSEWERLTKQEDVMASKAMVNELVKGKRDRFEIELQMRHKNGHWVDILSRAKAIFNDEGKGVRIVGTHVDISARKKSEKEIFSQKQKAEQYLNLAGVMFVGLDENGTVNLLNEKACNVLEYNQDEIIGKDWFDNFIPSRIKDEIRSIFKQLIEGNVERVEYYENPVINKTGKERHIAWHNTFITDDDNRIIGVLCSGEDITEKRMLQARLNQSQKMEAVGTLAGGIAHDFNNILSSIIGFSELALDDVEKGTLLENSLQEVYSAGKRAKDLVKQILAFARQSDEAIKPVKPSVIANEVIKFLRSTIPSTIEIQPNIESDSFVMGNPTQIHQILMNLCTNSAHAMEDDGGFLAINLKDIFIPHAFEGEELELRPGDYIELRVSDTGTGISPEIIDSIFEPYFTTKGPGEGTGMGLAMVQGIVEIYGGKITVESTVGRGTAFAIYLPVTRQRKANRQYELEVLPTGTERILFVDDEAPIAKIGSQGLERLGYQVTTRTSSVEALELFKAKPEAFDLVVTDMTMPNMNGDVLVAELLAIRPDIPVILCTGYSKRLSEETAFEIGIKAFAYKPIVKADLANIVRKVLDEAKG